MQTTPFTRRRLLSSAILVASGVASASPFVDPLKTPAVKVLNPLKASVLAMHATAHRIVGVGLRGLIILSEDQGQSWRQVESPVQSDLTAVHFPTDSKGWAVGQEGVVLHSADGGTTWVKQLDSASAASQFVPDYKKKLEAGSISEADFHQLELNLQKEAALPLLDVWFENELRGWVVGSFGGVALTNDGGRTWQAGLQYIDNADYLNLNSIKKIGDGVFIAAERGQVFKLDLTSQKFLPIATGYNGSFWGVTGRKDNIFAYGLRGNVYRSGDAGSSWSASRSDMSVAITGSAIRSNGEICLGNLVGGILRSSDGGQNFKVTKLQGARGLAGMIFNKSEDHLITFGVSGITLVPFV